MFVKKVLRKLRTAVPFVNKKKAVASLPDEDAAAQAELDRVKGLYEGYDKDHIWGFNAGHTSQDFRGNPKYLFVYINRYRPDIKAYWFCDKEETLEQVRALGFEAYKIDSPAAQYVINRTGVVVAEMVKFVMPEAFGNIKYINLWHGVGFKNVERKQFNGDISMDLARKYIKRSSFYRDHQLMNATCPVIEEEYAVDCGIDADKFLRVGYPRCLYQQNFEPVVSFDHDLKGRKGLPADAKIVVYTPTFRAVLGNTFSKAMPDFERLYQLCEKNNLLFIFKVHPNMEKETGFLKALATYGDRSRFLFWDNKDDFYEVMHQADLVVYDYTSMVSDFVAAGVPHYIRYVFDFEEYRSTVMLHDNYFEKTTGEMCYSFDELLTAIDTFQQRDETAQVADLNQRLWSYSQGKDDFERIIQAALDFCVEERERPTLYSFDIFDTLISRKCLAPAGIFYYVREKILADGGFPVSLREKYPSIRHTAEFNVREYYNKTKVIRESEKVEVQFDEIFARIANVYKLSEEQVEKLKTWELEAELDNVVPLMPQIDRVKELLNQGEHVVLISDMYLPKAVIAQMLAKADPVLATLPLFLSSEYGVLKTSQRLFFEVYKSFEPYYDFKKWIHCGDNPNADQTQPRRFQINTRKITPPEFNDCQQQLTEFLNTYDGYLVAALQARLREESYEDDDLVISFIALCFVPYIDWVLRDALQRGYKTLYFIARDGHHLKRIADAIIQERGLDIKTKYIYASRRTWRIPSFVHEVDRDFWEAHGSFGEILSVDKLLSAMALSREQFCAFFPYIDLDTIDFYHAEEFDNLREMFKNSESYKQYLVELAREQRKIVNGYLKQEIDATEKHAFVEYYGRGYTQDCYVRLWRELLGDDTAEVPFYYYRSICPDQDGAIRHNFTTNDTRPYFIESIFANMPYKSVQEYYVEDGVIKPEIVPIPHNKKLFASMNAILPEFAKRYARLELQNPEDTDHLLMEFVFHYYNENQTNPAFANKIGRLVDSVTLYGEKRELAPPLTQEDLDRLEAGLLTCNSMKLTSSIVMSATRTPEKLLERYREMYQILPGEPLSGGRLLTEQEQQDNKQYREKCIALEQSANKLYRQYQKAVKEYDITDTVVLVTQNSTLDNTGLEAVKAALEKAGNFRVVELCLGLKPPMEEIAATLAEARYVLSSRPIDLFCSLVWRPETSQILLPVNAFALYNSGYNSNHFLKHLRQYRKLTAKNDLTVIQVPSEHVADGLRHTYAPNRNVRCDLVGNCASDRYFDAEVCNAARTELEKLFPEAEGKKIIFYMPVWRTRKDCPNWIRMLDMEQLRSFLGDEYVVVVHFRKSDIAKGRVFNSAEVAGFSKVINKELSVRELMMACDVLIGDYRDEFFEAPLMHKPTFSTADDYETFTRVGNMSQNAPKFEQFLFCPVVANAEELAGHLSRLGEYDYAPMEAFRQKMLSGCDGHSVERLVNYLRKEAEDPVSWTHPDTTQAPFFLQ